MSEQERNYSSMSIGATENIVLMTGYLGKTEYFVTDSGVQILRGSIGTKKRVTNAETDETETVTQWHRFVCYRNRAVIMDRAIRGDNEQKFRIDIRGRLNESSYQSKLIPMRPDGKPNMLYSTEIVVDRVTFCGRINFAPAEGEDENSDAEAGSPDVEDATTEEKMDF